MPETNKKSPLYVFYGEGISYFFVADVNIKDIENSESLLRDTRKKNSEHFDKESKLEQNSFADNLSVMSRAKSTMYRAVKSKLIGDKGIQIQHEGLDIRQIVLTRVAVDYLLYMRKFSSTSINNMRKYYHQTTKQFNRDQTNTVHVVSNILILLEKDKKAVLGRFK